MRREAASQPTTIERVKLAVATGLGAGYSPLAPGTVGSVPGVLLAWALDAAGGHSAVLAGAVAVTAAGFWSAGPAARVLGLSDPGPVVVDEIAGQMLTLLFLPLSPRVLAAGFVLFRILDVVKPFPIRRLEKLPGGSGIMADDLAAGACAGAILHAVVRWLPGWLGPA